MIILKALAGHAGTRGSTNNDNQAAARYELHN